MGKGISSSVRFAAWMPASRAVPTTSPLRESPRATAARGLGRHPQDRLGAGASLGRLLVPHVDHPGGPLLVEMREIGQGPGPPSPTPRGRYRALHPAALLAVPVTSTSRFQIGASALIRSIASRAPEKASLAMGGRDRDDHARLARAGRGRSGARRPPQPARGARRTRGGSRRSSRSAISRYAS